MTDILQKCQLRRAQSDDAGALSSLAFRSKASWGYDIEFMKHCREELTYRPDQIDSSQYRVEVCDIEGEAVAFYALRLLDNGTAELEALFVRPEFTRNGIGSLLIEDMTAQARLLGVQTVTIQGDPNAEDFYLAIGAVPGGYRKSESIPGRYLPVFRLSIEKGR